MRIRTKQRSRLLLAAALLTGVAAPMAGANDKVPLLPSDIARAHAKPGPSTPRHLRSAVHLTTSRGAAGKAAQKASVIRQEAAPDFPADRRDALEIPPSVANANAQLTSTQAARNAMPLQAAPTGDAADADSPTAAPDPMPGAATPTSQGRPVVDQLAAVRETVVSGAEASAIGTQPSLIGSICIGIGALLTMASAARLYIAS